MVRHGSSPGSRLPTSVGVLFLGLMPSLTSQDGGGAMAVSCH